MPISRRRALELSGASAATLLAGCSGDGGNTDTDGSGSGTDSTDGSGNTDGSGGQTTVKLLTHFNSQTETFQGIIDRFEEENPGITVDMRQVTPQKLTQQFSTSLGTSTAPDMWGKGPGPGELGKFVSRGIPLNLSDELDESFTQKFTNASTCRYEDENPLSWQSPDGSLYGLPMVVFGNCYWYNKEVLADLGIPEEDVRGRSDITWQKFRDICKQAKEAGYTPIVMGGSNNAKNLGQWVGTSFHKQLGAETMMNTLLGQNDRKLNEEPFVEAMAKYQRLYEDEYINQSVTAITRAQSVNLFYKGDALFYFQGSYMPNQINRMIGEDAPGIHEKIGHFWHPYYPDAHENGKNELQGFTGDVMSLNAQAIEKRGNKEAAVSFFEHFFSKESQRSLFEDAGILVARNDAWSEDLTPEQEIQLQINEEIKNADKTYPLVPGSFLPSSREAFLSGVGDLFSGKDPQKIMDNIQKTHSQALEDFA